MAVYDGFFDAAEIIGTHADGSPEYDREYNSTAFVKYFANTIGSGVCIHKNQDSFKAEFEEDGRLFLRKGYLFIQGYWAANVPKPDEDPETYKGYEVVLPGNETYAIVAHLNFGQKRINIEVRSVSMAYPDALVLAIVNGAAQSAEDTRYNTDICGVIDTAGELSKKVTWAINYIDNEIEDKLAAAEADIAEQSKRLDAKIAEVQAQIDKIEPPPIGTIKFSAAQDVGPEWLRCNGDFISESQYPELVAALGKLTPSGDKFQLISDGEIAPQISNGVIYDGRMWVYSHGTKSLYGVDLSSSAETKTIKMTSTDTHWGNFIQNSPSNPICLSIIPKKVGNGARIFLSQLLGDIKTGNGNDWMTGALIFQADFSESETSISMAKAFQYIETFNGNIGDGSKGAAPYVSSTLVNGIEQYRCVIGHTISYYEVLWRDGGTGTISTISIPSDSGVSQRIGYSKKSKWEVTYVSTRTSGTTHLYWSVESIPNGLFSSSGVDVGNSSNLPTSGRSPSRPLNVIGPKMLLTAFDLHNFVFFSTIDSKKGNIDPGISLSAASRVFVDAGAYLWGKDIYMVFVGTGIIFSRTLEEGSFGYLDTTSVLGTITQFGYLDYSEDEGTLYLLGQDTSNRVKIAKIELNTLYDYANDGAWLPMIASDGVPAYIKAKEAT